MILRYTVTPRGRWTSLYLEDLGDNEYTCGGSRVRTLNNPFEFTESWQLYHLLCVAAIAHFFRSKYSLLVPCLGQINIYRLVSLTFCVALDHIFVVYTFRFCVASKNVRCKTQLLTPPSLYTWIISISPLMRFLPQSLMRELLYSEH